MIQLNIDQILQDKKCSSDKKPLKEPCYFCLNCRLYFCKECSILGNCTKEKHDFYIQLKDEVSPERYIFDLHESIFIYSAHVVFCEINLEVLKYQIISPD